MKTEHGTIGSSFDEFLEGEGIASEVSELATKKILAAMIQTEMEKCGISRAAMAKRMHTSRAQVQRLLDPENDSVTLSTMQRAARVVGRQVRIELV